MLTLNVLGTAPADTAVADANCAVSSVVPPDDGPTNTLSSPLTRPVTLNVTLLGGVT